MTIKKWRAENGMSRRDLADILGVHHKTIKRWENGSFIPPVKAKIMHDAGINMSHHPGYNMKVHPINKVIRKWRKNNGVKQKDLAKQLSVKRSILAKVEGGTRIPSRKLIEKLVSAGAPINRDTPIGECLCGQLAVKIVETNHGKMMMCLSCIAEERRQQKEGYTQ